MGSKTWKLENVNDYYSFFRIIMTDTNNNYFWSLYCSGMEIYGDLMKDGSISLLSNASIINYGQIKANGSINIECQSFENYGTIKSMPYARISIKSALMKN